MKKIIIHGKNFEKIDSNVACIGYFDGLHRGHRALINRTIELAGKKNLKSALICFEPDPQDIINSRRNKHLLSYEERIRMIEDIGIEQLIVIEFDEMLMNMTPEDFIDEYLNRFNIDTLICGFDFTFGHKGKGNSGLLKEKGNFILEIIEEVKCYGKKISSTRIKEALNKGNFSLVDRLLGFDYCLILKAEECKKKGSDYLVQASLYNNDCIMPKDGDYEDFFISDGKAYIISKTPINRNGKIYLEI